MAADRELLARLKAVPLFEGLSEKQLKNVLAQSSVVDHEAGQDIVEEGRSAVGFHLILEGQATVNQGSRIIGTIGPGDYFGEISVIDGKPRSATVMANSSMRTLALAAWDFRPLLDAHPALSRKILLGLCQTIRTAEAQLSETTER